MIGRAEEGGEGDFGAGLAQWRGDLRGFDMEERLVEGMYGNGGAAWEGHLGDGAAGLRAESAEDVEACGSGAGEGGGVGNGLGASHVGNYTAGDAKIKNAVTRCSQFNSRHKAREKQIAEQVNGTYFIGEVRQVDNKKWKEF